MGNLKSQIKHKISVINQFFVGNHQKTISIDFDHTVLDLNNYAGVLNQLGEQINQNQQRQTLNRIKLANRQSIQVNTDEPYLITERKGEKLPTFKRADMILLEILREKKRKGQVTDYYAIMEHKLIDLLDYVLQDQPEYQGLTSLDKMKLVLKNLEQFKGKMIDGQRKINLLRVFFEEFKNLKNDHTERIHTEVHIPTIIPYKNKHSTGEAASTVKKWHKKPQNNETMSMKQAAKKQSKKHREKQSTKSVKQSEDLWMGQLK